MLTYELTKSEVVAVAKGLRATQSFQLRKGTSAVWEEYAKAKNNPTGLLFEIHEWMQPLYDVFSQLEGKAAGETSRCANGIVMKLIKDQAKVEGLPTLSTWNLSAKELAHLLLHKVTWELCCCRRVSKLKSTEDNEPWDEDISMVKRVAGEAKTVAGEAKTVASSALQVAGQAKRIASKALRVAGEAKAARSLGRYPQGEQASGERPQTGLTPHTASIQRASPISSLNDRDKCMLALMTPCDWQNLYSANASMKLELNESQPVADVHTQSCGRKKATFFVINLHRVRGLDGPAFSRNFADHALYSKWKEQKNDCEVLAAAKGRAAAELLPVFRTLQGALDIVSQGNIK
jgi:hypothetical protein